VSVEWDGDLTALFDSRGVAPLLRGIAAREGRRLHERAVDLTPKRTGATAAAWERLPVTPTPDGFASGTLNRSYTARLLEGGWEEHQVQPKRRGGKRAVSTPEGARANATVPAYGGAHMAARAAEEVEATWGTSAAPEVEAWGAELERRASGRTR
jgi:hypothetical protein